MYGKKLAYVAKIGEIFPINGADKIELAKVMDYTVIVKKGEYKPGDLALYIEIDSILPDGLSEAEVEELGKVRLEMQSITDGGPNTESLIAELQKKEAEILAKSKYPYFEFLRARKFKIKSMKLGKFTCCLDGVEQKPISQGILFNLNEIGAYDKGIKVEEGADFTKVYNITEQVEDEEEAGVVKKGNFITRWLMRFAWYRNFVSSKPTYNVWLSEWPSKSDETNVQKVFTAMKAKYGDKVWVATEKLEGQNITIYSKECRSIFGKKKKRIGVCSRTRELKKTDSSGSKFWATVIREGLDEKIKNIPGEWFCRGEHLGPGIQKNIYKLLNTTVRFFDFYQKVDGKFVKLNYEQSVEFAKKYDLPFVPVLNDNYVLPQTANEMLAESDKNTCFGNDLKHKREGFVLRLKDDYSVSFKVKNPFYSI